MSLRPGRVAGDPVVTDIHCLRYDTNGQISFKLSFEDDYAELPRRPRPVDKDFQLQQLYSSRLPITKTKWNHLQELKSVIPSDFHGFYDNIKYSETSKKSKESKRKAEEKKESKKDRESYKRTKN